MENSTYLACNGHPWQATIPCALLGIRKRFIANQVPEFIHPTRKELTEEAVYMIYVILIFVGLAVIGSSITVYETFYQDSDKKHGSGNSNYIGKIPMKAIKNRKSLGSQDFLESFKSFLKCFCVVRNGSKILSTVSAEDQIGCFHGLRFLNNAVVISAHVGLMYLSFLKRLEELQPLLDSKLFQIKLNGIFAVDSFLVISGFLNANAFFQQYSRSNGRISWFHFFFKRFVRLTPVYMIVFGFRATLFTYTGTGIFWPTFDTNPACLKDWWWHLLYINNFEEGGKQCMPWCWYLAADMQFYMISPFFMVSLLRWPRLGYTLTFICISGSCIAASILTNQYNLIDGFSRIEFHLNDFNSFMIKFWEYFDVVYIRPYTRISSYLVAILLAYYLHMKKFDKGAVRNSTITLCCGWITAAICMWLCFFSLHKREEILMVTALYNGTKSLLFSCGMAWIVYLCITRQSEFLNKCLSWRYFLPLSRLTYCAYLIHPVIEENLGFLLPGLLDFSYISAIVICLYIFAFTYSVSFIVSILFEIPVLNLLDWFRKKKMEKNSNVAHLD